MSDEKTIDERIPKNLRPDLIRQRLIIKALTKELVKPDKIIDYLLRLAEVSEMEVVSGPFTSNAHELGYRGWVHWRTSGAHFYSYTGSKSHLPLITLDTYTCKPFSIDNVIEFTRKYFSIIELVHKEITI